MGPPKLLGARVLIVWEDPWLRALLRAQLVEEGYDAVGAPGLAAALSYPVDEPGRGPVRVLIVDQDVAEGPQKELVSALCSRYPDSRLLLLAKGIAPVPAGPWEAIVRRPTSVGEVVTVVKQLMQRTPSS